MSRRERAETALEAEIARLPDLGHDEQRKRWKLLFGRRAPKSLRRKFMARAVAYQMQVAAYGGLSAATKRRLREIATAISNGDRTGVFSEVHIKPGTQLIRQWQNTTHTVMVLDEGFALDGRTYKSLSAVAKVITGTNWNGYAFFGIKRAARGNKAAAGSKRDSPPLNGTLEVTLACPFKTRTKESRVRNPVAKPKLLKCAVYTRKSSEEGLEQDFNSLHAQRESCEAYIKSQKHEGWLALPILYDDGGYSGGSIERPALKKLLTDIQSRAVDVVVVYKVDRLTRSLADFAKIVEIFDAAGVSFVSVTQQFNTTTSMGRLTLNVLLSFAQFEREVTGERIRDKIAASKQKGMWMGGWVPIGYDRKDRTLVINEDEARAVRTIFELFLKLKNVRKVQAELARLKLATKPYPIATGKILGGLPFSRGHIYRILSNPLYIGEIAHKDIRHPGQHPRIIDQDTWEAVNTQIGRNRREHRVRAKAGHANLLAGLIFDEVGRPLVSSHTTKNGKRYLYYVTSEGSGRHPAPPSQAKLRLPATDVDAFVISAIQRFLTDNTGLAKLLRAAHVRSGRLAEALQKAEATSRQLENMPFQATLELVTDLIARIDVTQAGLRITFGITGIVRHLSGGENSNRPPREDVISVDFPMPSIVQNGSVKLVVTQPSQRSEDASLIAAIARGTCWFEELTSGKALSISSIASRENVTDSYISRILNLALLSPTIVHQVLDGSPAATKTAKYEMTGQRLSALWRKQA